MDTLPPEHDLPSATARPSAGRRTRRPLRLPAVAAAAAVAWLAPVACPQESAPPVPSLETPDDPELERADRLFRRRQWREAGALYATRVARAPDDGEAWLRLGYTRHVTGDLAGALAAYREAADLPRPHRGSAHYNIACVQALQGERDAAFGSLRTAIAEGFDDLAHLDEDPDLDVLRDDPRFRELRQRLAGGGAPDPHLLARGAEGLGALRRQFDFWLGDWRAEVLAPDAGNLWRAVGQLDVQVRAALGGQAILEFVEGEVHGRPVFGFSVRAVDRSTMQWQVVQLWPEPGVPVFGTLQGGFFHRRGEFFAVWGEEEADETRLRYSFSDVTEDSFRWDQAVSRDGGRSWRTDLIHAVQRRPASAGPLAIADAHGTSWGRAPALRTLDFLRGHWRGVRTPGAGDVRVLQAGTGETVVADGTRVEVHAERILEGAAMLLRTSVGEGDAQRESLAVLAHDVERRVWVQYGIEQFATRFERLEGVAMEERIELGSPGFKGAPPGGQRRQRWWLDDAGDLHGDVQESLDGGRTWRTLWSQRLSRTDR